MGYFTFIVITVILFGILMAGIFLKFKVFIITGIAGLLVMAFVGCKLVSRFQEERINELTEAIEYVKDETVPMEFSIKESSKGKKEVTVGFYDLAGKYIGRKSIKIEGNDIYLEFRVIKLDSKNYMFFPYVIYSNSVSSEEGEKIIGLYKGNENFPAIYRQIETFFDKNKIDPEKLQTYKEKITELYGYVLEDKLDLVEDQFGSAVHDYEKQGITKFKNGYTYQVICHTHTGSIEVQKKY